MKKYFIVGAFITAAFFAVTGTARAVDETTLEELVPNEFQGGGVAQGWNGDDDEWTYNLPFTFNFYGVDYDQIKIGSNGLICLDTSFDCTWYPNSISSSSYGPFIMPMGRDLVTSYNTGDDIYITENSNNVVIRWQGAEYNYGSDAVNFEVVLYSSGSIKINYGPQSSPLRSNAYAGISKGNGVDYRASVYNNTKNFNMNDTSAWGSFGPAAVSFYPSNNELNVPTDVSLSVQFDKNIEQGSGDIVVKNGSDDSAFEIINVSSPGVTGWGTNTLTIDLLSELASGGEYYIEIDGGAVQSGGGSPNDPIIGSEIWSFTARPAGQNFQFNDDLQPEIFIDESNTNVDLSGGIASLAYRNYFGSMDGANPGYDNISNSAGDSVDRPTIIIDDEENLVVAWVDMTTGNGDIYVSRWNGSAWSKMDSSAGYDNVSNDSQDSQNVSASIDASGLPIIAWTDNFGYQMTRWNGSAWTQIDGVTPGYGTAIDVVRGASYSENKIMMDAGGNPILVGINGYGVYASRWNGSAWTSMDGTTPGYDTIITNDSIDPGYAMALNLIYEIGTDGRVFVTLFNRASGSFRDTGNKIFFSHWDGSKWARMDGTLGFEILSGTEDIYSEAEIALGNDQNPIVVWTDHLLTGNGDGIYLSRWNGLAWVQADGITPGFEEIANTPGVSSTYPYVAVTGSGNPVVGWHERPNPTFSDYAFSYWNGLQWTHMDGLTPGFENISNSAGSTGLFQILIDRLGYPLLVYADDPDTGSGSVNDIRITRWNGTAWVTMDGLPGSQKVSNALYYAHYPDAVIDSNNFPVVAWSDVTYAFDTDIYVSRWFGNAISPATIQSTRISGLLTEDIISATLSASDTTPGASRIEYFLSNNGGVDWTEVQKGENLVFSATGQDLRWKAILYEGSSPTLDSVTVTYSTDATPPLRSNPQPIGVLIYGTISTDILLDTDEDATCKYDTIPGTPYVDMPNTFTFTGSTTHSANVTGLTDGTAYTFYVRCEDSVGNQNPDDFEIIFSVGVVPDLDAPIRSNPQPTGELSIGTTSTDISINTDSDATCKYDTFPDSEYGSMLYDFSSTGGTDHLASVYGLTDGTTYTYYVRCQDGLGNTNTDDFLITFSVGTAESPADDITAPTELKTKTKSSSEIKLEWKDNSDNETGFSIERKKEGGSFKEIHKNDANDTDFTDTDLDPDTEYTYRVRAYNATDNSDYSNEDSAETDNDKLKISSIQASCNSLLVTVDASSDYASEKVDITLKLKSQASGNEYEEKYKNTKLDKDGKAELNFPSLKGNTSFEVKAKLEDGEWSGKEVGKTSKCETTVAESIVSPALTAPTTSSPAPTPEQPKQEEPKKESPEAPKPTQSRTTQPKEVEAEVKANEENGMSAGTVAGTAAAAVATAATLGLASFAILRRKSVSGMVLESQNKSPLADVTLDIYDTDGQNLKQLTTKSDGTFNLNLKPGNYQLTAQKDGYRFPSAVIKGQDPQLGIICSGPFTVQSDGVIQLMVVMDKENVAV